MQDEVTDDDKAGDGDGARRSTTMTMRMLMEQVAPTAPPLPLQKHFF